MNARRSPLAIAAAAAALIACSGPEKPENPAPRAAAGECAAHKKHRHKRSGHGHVGKGGHGHGHGHVGKRGHGHKHHGGHHRFEDAQRWAKVFEAKSRDAWQKPDAVVAALGVAKDARIADIGAATGYFAMRFARAATAGKVFGIDIERSMVNYLGARAKREEVANVVAVLGATDDPKIPEKVDLIFVCDTYHHIADRPAYFGKLRAALRPGGRIAIVDFRMGDIPVGPPERMRIPPAQVIKEFDAAGYKVVKRDEKLLPYQYLLVFAPGA